jgi:hypothetical protein
MVALVFGSRFWRGRSGRTMRKVPDTAASVNTFKPTMLGRA